MVSLMAPLFQVRKVRLRDLTEGEWLTSTVVGLVAESGGRVGILEQWVSSETWHQARPPDSQIGGNWSDISWAKIILAVAPSSKSWVQG